MNIFLVIPTIRSLDFLREWRGLLSECHLVIVEDHEKNEIHIPKTGFKKILHYAWADIRKDFGENEWIFSRQNAGIRSYGFWKAYRLGADVVITIDDDCFPADRALVRQHVDNLRSKAPGGWFATFPHPSYMFTRGFPYHNRNKSRVVISHGLWSDKMDMDAKTQTQIGDVNVPAYPPIRQFVPAGCFFPMSSMNLAFSREAIPLMYFPIMGKDPRGKPWGYDRYDDIWAGLFVKKIIDHLGWSAVNGSPFVQHRKASDTAANLIKEKRGMATNETLWKAVGAVELFQKTPALCYRELARKIGFPKTAYFKKLRQAMEIWASLF